MQGHAAVDSKGEINLKTLMPTVLGAKMNALLVIGRFDIRFIKVSDEMIEELFELVAKIHDVTIKKVNVTLAGEND